MSNKILGFICAFPDFWKKMSAAFKQLCLLFIGKGEKKKTSQRHCNNTENIRRRNDYVYKGD